MISLEELQKRRVELEKQFDKITRRETESLKVLRKEGEDSYLLGKAKELLESRIDRIRARKDILIRYGGSKSANDILKEIEIIERELEKIDKI